MFICYHVSICVVKPHTPFCQLHLRPSVLSPPLSVWLSFRLLTRNVPKPDKFPISFYSCLQLIWKLEECLLLTQMVNGHETPGGSNRQPTPRSRFSWVQKCFSLCSQILFLALASLNLLVPLMLAEHSCNASWSSSAQSCLYVSYPQQTS